jgi:hypothetical protein
VPTLLGLWFVRGNAKLWNAVAVASLGFAVAGLLAVLAPLVVHGAPRSAPHMLVDLLGLSQLLGAPLWLAAFGMFALLAPSRPARRPLAVAVAVELAIGACAFVHWFVPSSPL